MAFYTRHETNCGVFCFVAWDDVVGLRLWNTLSPARRSRYPDEKCVHSCLNHFGTRRMQPRSVSLTRLTNAAVSAPGPGEIKESIEV